ncbi:MAG: T9SS type A sorting domain-containing protein [Sphingobacteriales bacterium]|nr:MAG: T9SS type A sorting domain-containing protein [Sphingobacteriales bacterium]
MTKNTGKGVVCKYSLFIIYILAAVAATAQPNAPKIYLKKQTLSPAADAKAWTVTSQAKGLVGHQQVLIQFSVLPNASQKELLQLNGVMLGDYVPDNTFISVISNTLSPQLIESCSIRSVVPMQAEWKTDEGLSMYSTGDYGNVEVQLSTIGVETQDVQKMIAELGGQITKKSSSGLKSYSITIPKANLLKLAAWYGTSYVNPLHENVPLNFESKTATRSNVAFSPVSNGGYGLSGKGVVVGVGDNVSGITHVDLKDRIINYNPASYTNHGVHINGIVGAAGIIDPRGEGQAPKATLVDHFYSQVWEQTPAMFEAHNMTITNNSYAAAIGDCRYSGTYDIISQELDKMTLQYNQVLHVFAAGNDGKLNCSPYPAGFATVTGGYQPAKNNIVVTSTDKQFVNAIDGSRGPVKDGRLKPEITAVGVDVMSTTRTDAYLVSGGTSMACPGVAGGLALLTERYRQINGAVNPRADVLKTVLLNGAIDIGNPGPDYRFGFGFMNIQRSLRMLDGNTYTTKTINNSEEQTLTINVPAGTAQLKVMLCWHDQPASPTAAKQLVNDLDLEVMEPNSTLHRPLVLDATPANILKNATEQADRLNNTEQIVVDAPQPGSYTIAVKGFNIPTGAQDYVVAYDFVPAGIKITYPDSNAQVKSGDRLMVYWDAKDTMATFSLEYSTDNGDSWTMIDDNIPGNRRYHKWEVPASINSAACRLRLIQKNTASNTSPMFIATKQPALKLSTDQCPGYMNFEWEAVPNANAYEILRKVGANMEPVDTVDNNTTAYTFGGLALDSFYFAAVRPMVDGKAGYRSMGIYRKPNDGNCKNPASNGDLMIQAVVSPSGGRKLTSTELKANDTLTLLLRNLDDAFHNFYRVSYSINNGPWTSQILHTPLEPNATKELSFTGLDLSAVGTYTIKAAVENMDIADPQHGNDTITRVFRHLSNNAIDLATPFTDDFESLAPIETFSDSVGLSINDRWDYFNANDTGRLRTFVNKNITIGGNRSVSLDAVKHTAIGSQNAFIGTFNLSNYEVAGKEVRIDFDYILHGQPSLPKDNEVMVRGSDTNTWQRLFVYNANSLNVGEVQKSGSISINDALSRWRQLFSTSTQIRFAQNDVSVIGNRDYGRGLTFDNVRIYTVENDMQLLQIVSPEIISCGLAVSAPLTIKIYNSVNNDQSNVRVFYQMGNGQVVSETIPSIKGKQTIDYTFKAPMSIPTYDMYTVSVWLAANGDTYKENDSVLNFKFRNQPKVNGFPYFENFEANNGGWYSDGPKNSWEYGTPQSEKINGAASGTKAWKTNLDGNYATNEIGYLYSPCFDLSQLANPTLRLKMAYDIEYCGIVYCDAAYLEYSIDGAKWDRVGTWKEGTNWYSDTLYDMWSQEDNTMWHEASTPLPKLKAMTRFRFVFTSDPGSNREGIAVDDIEVFDKKFIMSEPGIVSVSPNPTRDGNIKIGWNAYAGTEMSIVITDISGRQVLNTKVQAEDAYTETKISTPTLQSGIYFLNARIGDRRYVYKIVYQRN